MRDSQIFTRLVVATFWVLASASSVFGAIPNVPPEILAELKSMSPAEQRAFATQYGFDLDQVLGVVDSDGERQRPALGAPGEPLRPAPSGDDFLDEEVADEQLRAEEAEEAGEVEEEAEELLRFGANLFDSEVSTFAPVDNIPVPEGYRLGVGDELRVMLIGKEQGDFPLLVDRDGSVTLPKLGRVVLSGLTFPEAKTLIEKRVNKQLIGSEAILSMGSLRSINVFIAGEVKKPGNYSVSALSTLSQAIYIAGGISDVGSYRSVQLKRQGKTVGAFDIYDLLLYGNNSGDIRLQNGDVVFVPVVGMQASMDGSVVRPAIYELTAESTIRDLLKMAGGTLATANTQQALLRRNMTGAFLPYIENLNLVESEDLNLRVIDGDSLYVPEMPTRASNPLSIEGDTALAGTIAWSDGLKIADVFRDLEADVEPSADLNLSLIVRRKNSFNDIEVISFSLSKASLAPSSDDNITLQPFDRVVILPQATLTGPELRRELVEPIVALLEQQTRSGERAQVVTIAGAVREPGRYPLIGDGYLTDVVALAGGFTDAAYLRQAEVRRIQINERQEVEIEILNVNLAESNFRLAARDALRINSIPNWSTDDTVELTGEFLFPGTYTISEGETLASLIERAGGFTRNAFLSGAQFFSSAARASQALQLRKISANVSRQLASRQSAGQLGGPVEAEITDAAIDEELLGRVVVDLQGVVDGVEAADRFVGAGDTLFVPKFSNTIAVVGEVYEPGTFKFEENWTLKQYIETAGGATDYALNKNTYVLKADGSVQFYKSNALKGLLRFETDVDARIQAGDAIVVPTNLDYERPLTRVSAATSVIFQSLSSVVAFLNLAK